MRRMNLVAQWRGWVGDQFQVREMPRRCGVRSGAGGGGRVRASRCRRQQRRPRHDFRPPLPRMRKVIGQIKIFEPKSASNVRQKESKSPVEKS